MEGWSSARIRAYKLIDTNPNAYYYRFNKPGEKQGKGKFTPEVRLPDALPRAHASCALSALCRWRRSTSVFWRASPKWARTESGAYSR